MSSQRFNSAISGLISEPVYSTGSAFDALLEDYLDQDIDKVLKQEVMLYESYKEKKESDQAKRNNKSKKRKSTKQRAEEQFECNKSVSLKTFFDGLTMEEIFPSGFLPYEESDSTIEIEENNEHPILEEEKVIAELIVAKNQCPDELLGDYGLNIIFDESVNDLKEVLSESGIKPEELEKRTKIDDDELFVQRRLFSSVQRISQVDPEFANDWFLVPLDHKPVDVSKLFPDDDRGIEILRGIFLELVKRDRLLSKFLQHDQLNMTEIEKLFPYDKFRRLQHYLVCIYVLFNDPGLLKNRSTLARNLHPCFKESPVANHSLKFCFNSIGLGFFNDYFNFFKMKSFISNMILLRYENYKMKGDKENLGGKKKIRISENR